MKQLTIFMVALLMSFYANAQDDLLNELDGELENDEMSVSSVFKGLKIVNLESTKLAAKGDFYFVIAHRFGSVKGGFKDLFGLDDSNIRFSFLYGFTDWLTAGLSRSSLDKTYDFSTKLKLKTQEKDGFPLSIVGFGALAYKTADPDISYTLFEDKHRVNYIAELLISRKVNKNLSLQFSPMFVHENFVVLDEQSNDQYGLGFGGRYKLSKRLTLNIDYIAHLNRTDPQENSGIIKYRNPLSVGFDIETGGHVFQVHFTNSRKMNDAGLLNAEGDWSDGNFFFGFNLSRVF